jgi:coproporphyrinogen III oxidase-like Fe-S oxidoreductase
LPEPDLAWEMQLACQALLEASGYGQYEVSAYAKPGQECRHNLNYWHFGDYIGIGAGAHGKLTRAEDDRVWRTTRHKQPRTYLEAESAAGRLQEMRQVASADLPFEYLLNALRVRGGFELAGFEAATGLSASVIEGQLGLARSKGLLEEIEGGRWRASDLGWRFLNDLQAMFLSAGP